MDNKSKTDRIFEQLPRFLNARNDANWSSLVSAIGSEDQRLADLIEEVRKQFFVKTASRPYIDRLAANNNLTRPRFVGMSDNDFRNYIPILSYQPKQVKRIIDQLLDLFFFKEATTAFLSSDLYEPFILEDGWGLQLAIDNLNIENIVFRETDFTDISNATANEVAAAYNRQAQFSFAVSYFDSISKRTFLRIFTNTIGAQGSMIVSGGLSNIGFELNGFLPDLGSGSNTQWNVTKIGNEVTFIYTGGIEPGVEFLEPGDIFLCNLSGNQGTFEITDVDVENRSFEFINLLATTGSVTQISAKQTKFLRPVKITSYSAPRRALVWETAIGEATVELPATPPIVQRPAKGGFHINGSFGVVTEINSATSLTVLDSTNFASSGSFIIEPVEAITARLEGGAAEEIVTYNNSGRVISDFIRYSYSGLAGNQLTGISPDLPTTSALEELTMTALSKSSGIVTGTVANDFNTGDHVFVRSSTGIAILSTTGTTSSGTTTITGLASTTGVAPQQLVLASGIPAGTKVLSVVDTTTITISRPATASATVPFTFSEDTNGAFNVLSANATSFTYAQLGTNGTATIPGVVSREQLLLAPDGFKIIVTTSVSSEDTGIKGPYVWDLNAPFVLSADTSTSTDELLAGRTYKLLTLDSSDIPEGNGYIVIDFGQDNQEGPIKYLYKAAENILALDPSYTFQQNHDAGCSVVAVSRLGPHVPGGFGDEYPPYLTNPPDARAILQELITSVASAGIFIDFIVKYPNQLYGTLEVYE